MGVVPHRCPAPQPLGTPIACVNPYAAALCFSSGRDDAAEYRERLALCGQAARGVGRAVRRCVWARPDA